MTTATSWEAGTHVAGPDASYTLERPLGEGGFGATWLAKRASDGVSVALKALHIHRLKEWKSLELFERETAVLRRLDHAHIPNYVDSFRLGDDAERPDGLVLVQEFVDGRSLAATMQTDAPTDEASIVRWMAQVLGVLDYLHGLTPPVIHRDVKPGNVLVDGDGKAWLVDFGTVQAAVRSADSVSSTSAGTFGFAPMEQFVGAAFPSSDLYGLAMTALAVASKSNPADMPFSGVRVDVRKLVDFDARLVLLLERMTEPDPDRRLASARLALDQLRPLVHRYDKENALSATAMRAVAEKHRKAAATGNRAAMRDEDLLPSEQIREAGVRMGQLDGRVLKTPGFEDALRGVDRSAITATGELLGVSRFVLDASDYREIGRVQKEHAIAAFDATGEVLLAKDDSTWGDGTFHVYRRAAGGYKRGAKIESELSYPDAALSPDGATAALADDDHGAIVFDARNGAQLQRIEGKWENVMFTPDGGGLLLVNRYDEVTKIMLGSGGERVVKDAEAAAISADGGLVAVFGDKGAAIYEVKSDGLHRVGRRFGPGNKSWRRAAFSPDGQWVAACNYSDDRIEVFNVPEREHHATVRNPNQPKSRISSIVSIGFSANSDRLFVGGDLHFSRYHNDDAECLAVWSMPDMRYLGAIVSDYQQQAALLWSERGFVARPIRKGKGGASKKDGARQGPKEVGADWIHHEAARAGLLGRPVDEVLDATQRARLADVEARWRFAYDLLQDGRLDGKAELPQIVNVMTGLTHVADAVLREARAIQQATPTFGGGRKAVALSADQLKLAAEKLRGRSPEELAVIHEELVEQAAAAEQAVAKRVAKKRKKKAPTRAVAPARPGPDGLDALPGTEAFVPVGDIDPTDDKTNLWIFTGICAAIIGAIVYFTAL